MEIQVLSDSNLPIYRQIADGIERDIRTGILPAGTKLPTVRDLSDQLGASRGTVKHAYDHLEQLGVIEMNQGKGTFVLDRSRENGSKKERAVQLIDRMIYDLEHLSFSSRDIRIFFDLRMRQREQSRPHVRLGVVDCNPEALLIICNQMMSIDHVDIYQYLLENLGASSYQFVEDLDLMVTTTTHYEELKTRVEDEEQLLRIALTTSQNTVAALAQIPHNSKVGLLCKSKKFASIMMKGFKQFSGAAEPEVFLFDESQGIDAFLANKDLVITPVNYTAFCSREQAAALIGFSAQNRQIIGYNYHIDKGSLLHLGEVVDRMYDKRVSNLGQPGIQGAEHNLP